MTLVVALGLTAGQGAAKTKPLKLGKEGQYAQVFKNEPGIWQDDTSVTAWVKNRKIIGFWVTSNFKTAGGKVCAPAGQTPALMPDMSLTGPVWVTYKLAKPISLNGRNRFSVKTSSGYPFQNDAGGSVTGRLLPTGKLSVTARLADGPTHFRGRCSTSITAPKTKFRAMNVDGIVR
ncbi:MAG: hypothetical protein KDB52_04405 [Solirubrobacterales bacterium]|nr:hypothetical protein [Solirubrobacterales bacterium]